MLLHGGDELVGLDVGAQVNGLEASALKHHLDQVLADVVQVAPHRADDVLARAGHITFRQQWAQDAHASPHGAGSDEHLRHKQVASLEVLAHLIHAGDETAVENLGRRHLLIQCLLDQVSNDFVLAVVQVRGDLF